MIATIVGYENIAYTNKDNREVKGLRLFYTYQDEGTVGQCCDTVYISGSSPAFIDKVEIGKRYDLNFQFSSFSGKTRLASIKPV